MFSSNTSGSFRPILLGEIQEQHGIDDTAALFTESTGRVLVYVGREDDLKFVGLREDRGIPVLRIGVTDGAADTTHLEIQGLASWPNDSLRNNFQNGG